ncbi:MAG TPA: hypothetical protein VN704_10030 [Verrucomicrobiae bacterium]|nr:hypothetical protein [Verrucomicrobiae bacterium]
MALYCRNNALPSLSYGKDIQSTERWQGKLVLADMGLKKLWMGKNP